MRDHEGRIDSPFSIRARSWGKAFEGRTFLRVWSLGAIFGILLLEAAAMFAAYDRELPWPGASQWPTRPSCDTCRPIMSKGSCWPRLPQKRLAARIFAHSQNLWRQASGVKRGFSRVGGQAGSVNRMQICSAEERPSMPGLLDTAHVAKLRSTEAQSFDRLFVELMTKHKGAVAMADSEFRHGSDQRLRIMAHAIRHEQQG
jgi:Domain of unknown function (DUF305)